MPQEQKFLKNLPFLLYLSIGVSLLSVVASHIPLGSKLSMGEDSIWVSSKGSYAIGFFNRSDEPYQHCLGIHFSSASIPLDKQTIVWVAGADTVLGNMSYFQLTHNGDLVLFDSSKGVIAWSSKTSQFSVASAVLRDDGNLVLLNKLKQIVWQSFDTPSDTLLPGQNFNVHQTLRAASKNSVSSYYSLYMNASGELQLRWESDVVYWTSDSLGTNLSAVLTNGGALQLQDQTLKPTWSVFGEDHNDSVDFRFLRLDVDGNLRLYSWVEDSQSWRTVWQAVENQCNVFATCGQHGVCVLTTTGSIQCQCPFKFASDPNSKCLGLSAQGCESGLNMVQEEHTFLYGLYPPNDTISEATLEQCKNLCLNDSLCTAATFMADGTAQCLMKHTRYISGYSYPSVNSVSFVKRCSDPLPVNPNLSKSGPNPIPSQLKERYSLCIPCLLGAASGTFVVLLLIQFGLFFYIYKRRNLNVKNAALRYKDSNFKSTIMLSVSEIVEITGNFKHKIGPKVYKGMLLNNQAVAVKDMEATIEERKFRSTVTKIGNMHHKNLAKLEGYCCEVGHRYLVYEYAKHGSLRNCIEEDSKLSKSLTWRKRRDICISVAKAICYLHSECREFVSHGNLKCENVVLGENLEAKVTEFGLQRLCNDAHCNESAELDIEAFGKMVLVLVTGCVEVEWAYNEWKDGLVEKVVDKRIDGGVDIDELDRVLRISFWCLQRDGRLRPSMGEVVKVLEGTLTVDPPPSPYDIQNQTQVAEEVSMELGSELHNAAEM